MYIILNNFQKYFLSFFSHYFTVFIIKILFIIIYIKQTYIYVYVYTYMYIYIYLILEYICF